MDLDKLNKMNMEELLEYAKNFSMNEEKLSMPYVKVKQLLDFISVLDKNEKDYQDITNTSIIKNKNLNIKPTSILTNYIILEIFSFYEILKNDYPSLKTPDYYETLRKFRGLVIGHLDKSGGLKTGEAWMKQYKKIDNIGIKKIIEDFFNKYKELLKLKNKVLTK